MKTSLLEIQAQLWLQTCPKKFKILTYQKGNICGQPSPKSCEIALAIQFDADLSGTLHANHGVPQLCWLCWLCWLCSRQCQHHCSKSESKLLWWSPPTSSPSSPASSGTSKVRCHLRWSPQGPQPQLQRQTQPGCQGCVKRITSTYAYIYMCVYIYMCIYIYICMCIYIYMYAHRKVISEKPEFRMDIARVGGRSLLIIYNIIQYNIL